MQNSLIRYLLLAVIAALVASPAFSFIEDKYRRQVSVPADINADGYVNGADLGQLLGRISQVWDGFEDINRDGVVDSKDMGLLLGSWSDQALVSLKHSTGDLRRRTYFVSQVVTIETSPFDKAWTRVWVRRAPDKPIEGFDIHLRFEDVLTILWMRGWLTS